MTVKIDPLTGGLNLGFTDTNSSVAASESFTDDWTRPSEWPSLPSVIISDQKFAGLVSVYDNDANYIALSAAGNYTVDWGDGTVENVSSGVTAQHQYTYNNANLTSTSYGYKCAIVTVVPQSGQNLTTFNLNVRHSTLNQTTTSNWLDIKISLPNCSASGLTIGGSNPVKHRSLQKAEILNFGNCTSLASLFAQCISLRSVSLGSTAAITDMTSMFESCFMLKSVSLFDTSAVKNMSYMFANCYNLRSLPTFDTSQVLNMTYMFNLCRSLQSVPLFNTALVTNMVGTFSYCYELLTVPLFNTASVTDMTYMFQYCYKLETVPLFNTVSVKYMNSMFYYCTGLKSVPLFNTVAVKQMNNMFYNCYNIQSIPAFTTTSVTTMNSMLYGCTSLTSIPLLNTSLVTDMGWFCAFCSSLKTVPLFNLSSALYINNMFSYCDNLQSVPLFNTATATSVSGIFNSCYNITSIPAFNFSGVTNSSSSFASAAVSLASSSITGMRYSIDYSTCCLSKDGLENIFTNLGKAYNTSQIITISNNYGADTAVSKSNCVTTASSAVVTCSNTSSLTTGMICTGTGINTGVAVTFQGGGVNTVTLNNHGLTNGTMISFSTIATTTGIVTYTNYWVVNSTTNTFQVSATQGGNPITLTNNGSGTLLYPAYITSIDPNVSVTLSAPASANGTVTLSFRKLNTFKATSKGWQITG